MAILWILLGIFLGGNLGVVVMCCFQIHRVNKYEKEVRKLKEEQNPKK